MQLLLQPKPISDVPTLSQSLVCPAMMQFTIRLVVQMQLFVGLHRKTGHKIISFKIFKNFFLKEQHRGEGKVVRMRVGQLCF